MRITRWPLTSAARPFQPDLWTGAPADGQVIQQVWFAGVHSNIGGGLPQLRAVEHRAETWLAGRAATQGP